MEKKYSVNMQDDMVVSVEVDGMTYTDLNAIPDPEDRAKVDMLISRTMSEHIDDVFDEEFDKEFAAEFQQMQRETAHFPRLLMLIFLGIAALLLMISAFSAAGAIRRLAREQSVPGQVVDLVVRSSWDNDTQRRMQYTYPVVSFSLPGGELQEVELAEGSNPPAYAVGQEVTVLYDPQRLGDVRIKSFGSSLLLWLLPGITGFVGLAFLAVSLLMLRANRPRASQTVPVGL